MIQRRNAVDIERERESKASREFPIAAERALSACVEPISTDENEPAHKVERLAAYLRARDR
jgi:hypothetical protein